MQKDNNRFGKAHRANIYDNERAENWVPEPDVVASTGVYDNVELKDRPNSRISSSKRWLFIALGAGILIVAVIVIIVLAATGRFHHGKGRQSMFLRLVLKIKFFSIIKCRRK